MKKIKIKEGMESNKEENDNVTLGKAKMERMKNYGRWYLKADEF